jgi:hypothetical protein
MAPFSQFKELTSPLLWELWHTEKPILLMRLMQISIEVLTPIWQTQPKKEPSTNTMLIKR